METRVRWALTCWRYHNAEEHTKKGESEKPVLVVEESGESGAVGGVFGGDVGEVIVLKLYCTHSVTVPQCYSINMAGPEAGESNVVEECGELFPRYTGGTLLVMPRSIASFSQPLRNAIPSILPEALPYLFPDRLHNLLGALQYSILLMLHPSNTPVLRRQSSAVSKQKIKVGDGHEKNEESQLYVATHARGLMFIILPQTCRKFADFYM